MNLEAGSIFHAVQVGLRSGSPAPFRLGRKIEVAAQTGSTNDDVAARARNGEAEGLVILAERQTAGRGRKGARWEAAAGMNLTFSVLLRPAFPIQEWPRFSLAAGVALIRGIAPWVEHPSQLSLKWPNDVYAEGRKLAGILVESHAQGSEPFVVLGIGLNVNSLPEEFPLELVPILTTIRALTPGRVESDRNALAGSILAELNRAYGQMEGQFELLLEEARVRSWLIGKDITFRVDGVVRNGRAVDLGENGELTVLCDGVRVEQLLSAEEVRLAESL